MLLDKKKLSELFPHIKGNTLRVLEAFYSCHGAVTVQDICEVSGFKESTVIKGTGVLEKNGLLGHVGDGWMLTVDAPQLNEIRW